MSNRIQLTQRALLILLILTLAFSLRALTANFLRAHIDDAGWFPYGIYNAFDRPAQDWLDGRGSIFWIDDPSRTDKATYAPGYPLWLALIYKISGSRSPLVVQKVQLVADSLAVLLVIGVGVSAFGWRVGLWAGGLAAVWPLLATYGGVPLADAPTEWIILGGAWTLLLAVKRQSLGWAILSGALAGASCWLRANAMLLALVWALAIFFLMQANWRRRFILGAGVVLGSLLLTAPIIVRNAVAFHAFVPTGLGAGTNLLEGIGETDRGTKEFGAPPTDKDLLEQERLVANPQPNTSFELYYPNGVERDRARTRRALEIIRQYPFWYVGTVMRRMASVMKFAGTPSGIYGSTGINVTSPKCLPPASQHGSIAFLVNVLGMLQSVLRYLILPLMIIGVVVAVRRDWRTALVLLASILYYLVIGSLMHTHIRYGLPMYALLLIFAGIVLSSFRIPGHLAKLRPMVLGATAKRSKGSSSRRANTTEN